MTLETRIFSFAVHLEARLELVEITESTFAGHVDEHLIVENTET